MSVQREDFWGWERVRCEALKGSHLKGDRRGGLPGSQGKEEERRCLLAVFLFRNQPSWEMSQYRRHSHVVGHLRGCQGLEVAIFMELESRLGT